MERLVFIISLFALGFIGLIGVVFCGATHHALTAGLCIIFALRLLSDYRKEVRGRHSHN